MANLNLSACCSILLVLAVVTSLLPLEVDAEEATFVRLESRQLGRRSRSKGPRNKRGFPFSWFPSYGSYQPPRKQRSRKQNMGGQPVHVGNFHGSVKVQPGENIGEINNTGKFFGHGNGMVHVNGFDARKPPKGNGAPATRLQMPGGGAINNTGKFYGNGNGSIVSGGFRAR